MKMSGQQWTSVEKKDKDFDRGTTANKTLFI